MARWSQGNRNGSGKTRIDFIEKKSYALICPHDSDNLPHNIAFILHSAFTEWLAKHPNIRVRTTLPINQDGQTIAIHVWFDSAD